MSQSIILLSIIIHSCSSSPSCFNTNNRLLKTDFLLTLEGSEKETREGSKVRVGWLKFKLK